MAIATASRFTDYNVGASGSRSAGDGTAKDYWPLSKCKKAYSAYLSDKREEIEEQQNARRYRHGAQYTAAQLETLRRRKQPAATFNRIGRKIAGVVGLVEKLRQDPKAFPRTPKHEQGAELSTAVIRYVLDEQDWRAKSPCVAEDGAIDGIGGIEFNLVQGDTKAPDDYDIEFDVVEPDSFFYDPRSCRLDFSDARYMGVGKWVDIDTAKDMFPDHADELESSAGSDADLSSNSDREAKWFSSDADGVAKKVRIVDLWYQHKGGWCWAIFTGSTILSEGQSPFKDEKGKTICKFVMFSANVDHDGDRYGFIRDLRDAQDSLNFKQAKLNHILASKRLIMTNAAVNDIETARREWARPDGVILTNAGNVNETVKADDLSFEFAGWAKLLEDAKAEIENFGPNPALIGQGIENKSGRAIALLQQAGIAELGPYILAYRGWKIRVYRALWNIVQRYWTADRWIRVTDDDNLAQFIQVNGVGIDPATGLPTVVNALGSLDVDIILDEGPDNVNMQADIYETMQQVLPAVAAMLTPAQAQAAVGLLIDTSPLQADAKKKFREASQQPPDPMAMKAKRVEMEGAMAKVDETKSKAVLNIAKARETGMPDLPAQPQPTEFELPPDVQIAQALADIDETQAAAAQKRAQAGKLNQDAAMLPFQMAQEASDRAEDRKARASAV